MTAAFTRARDGGGRSNIRRAGRSIPRPSPRCGRCSARANAGATCCSNTCICCRTATAVSTPAILRRPPRRCALPSSRFMRSPRSTPISPSCWTTRRRRRRLPCGSATASPARCSAAASCLIRCATGSGRGCASCGRRAWHEHASADSAAAAVAAGHTDPAIPPYTGLEAYRAAGGYRLLQACRAGERTVEQVIAALEHSGLRGLGGAGFPTGRKWRLVRQEQAPRLLAVNADEGEPGTFKDRYFLETDPHRFLEGMLIAAWAIEAEDAYIYLRDEYPQCRLLLEREIAALEQAGLAGGVRIHLRRGAGDYICGEESAMLESLEGKRGLPRHKPPFPAQVGLFGRPTLINNLETLYWVRDLVEKGPEWFTAQGRHGRKGLRTFSVSGRVREPGVKLAPAGITARELIDEFCGGMLAGHHFKGYLPGGASGGILPAAKADIPLDFGTLEGEGCFIGSAAVVVLSDHDDMREVALNLLRFFEDESCGQCTPCRVGTEKAVKLMTAPRWDAALLEELARVMSDASICGLGQAAMNPVRMVLKHFRDEVAGPGQG